MTPEPDADLRSPEGDRVRLRFPLRSTLILTVASLLLYALLHREALHQPDAPYYLGCVQRRELFSHHFLYLPLAAGLHSLLAPFGFRVFDSMIALSAISGGIATAMAHRALLALEVPRWRACLGACAFATCPGILFFATTVEIHVPFVAVANAAFWSAAVASRDPGRRGLPGAVRTGVLTALATGVHATGQLLPWPIAMLFLLRGRRVLAILVMGATHLVMVRVFGYLATGGTAFLDTSRGALMLGAAMAIDPVEAAGIAWREWLLAFLPSSVVALAAMVVGPSRREARFVGAALVPYLVVNVLLVKNIVEYGAYTVPMALPLVWIAVRVLPVRAIVACIAIGASIGIWQGTPLREPAWQAALGADAVALHREAPMWVLARDADEVQALARAATEVPSSNVTILAVAGALDREMLPALRAAWDQAFDATVASGRRMVLLQSALDWLRDPSRGLLAEMMRDVDARYDWRLVERGAFRGFEPRRR